MTMVYLHYSIPSLQTWVVYNEKLKYKNKISMTMVHLQHTFPTDPGGLQWKTKKTRTWKTEIGVQNQYDNGTLTAYLPYTPGWFTMKNRIHKGDTKEQVVITEERIGMRQNFNNWVWNKWTNKIRRRKMPRMKIKPSLNLMMWQNTEEQKNYDRSIIMGNNTFTYKHCITEINLSIITVSLSTNLLHKYTRKVIYHCQLISVSLYTNEHTP